jgi:hypothetical protein
MYKTSIILYKNEGVNTIVMFIYASNNAENRKEIESEKVNKAEL